MCGVRHSTLETSTKKTPTKGDGKTPTKTAPKSTEEKQAVSALNNKKKLFLKVKTPIKKKSKRKAQRKSTDPDSNMTETENDPEEALKTIKVNEIKLEEIDQDYYKKKAISASTVGSFTKARWLNSPVSLKPFLDRTSDQTHSQRFWSEVNLLSSVQHPNIMQFLGACTELPDRCFVFEWLDTDLGTAIEKNHQALSNHFVSIAKDVCRGLLRLHSIKPHAVFHRDIKPENVMLTKTYKAKLTNIVTPEKEAMVFGTFRYRAPELCDEQSDQQVAYTSKADIYSYGSLLYELLTGGKPYHELNDSSTQLKSYKKEKVHPTLPDRVPMKWREILNDCWSEPEKRPETSALLISLRSVNDTSSSRTPFL